MTPRILQFGNNDLRPDELTTHIELDASVIEIPKGIFSGLRKLVEVTIHEDGKAGSDKNHVTRQEKINRERRMMKQSQLTIIGTEAFWDCPHLRHVTFPSGLERIEAWAFGNCPKLQPPQLPDSLESIGPFAFCGCNFRHLRIPQSITRLSNRMLEYCTKLYSIEVPETLIMNTNNTSFYGCERLRNVVFPNIEEDLNQPIRPWCHGCEDLLQVIADPNELYIALAHRFDGLPIHRLCYFQSYHGEGDAEQNRVVALKEKWASFDSSSYPLNPSASSLDTEIQLSSPKCRQDFLGMTPLHITALSTVPQQELMETMIDLDPIQLVTPDFWGSLPIYYACESWNADSGSNNRIRLLLQRHVANFPDFKLDWTKLVTATGHMELAKLLLFEASSILNNVPDRLQASSIPTKG